jgi:uroporphyrinogen-III synthase
MHNQIRIASTKQLLEHQKNYLLNANFLVLDDDYIKIKNKNFEIDTINDCLIFTSQNAVESVLRNKKIEKFKGKKSFCVGEKTKALLEKNGFEVLESSDYASELGSIICNKFPKISFTFFCGNLRRDVLPDALKLANVTFDEIEVYQTILIPHKVEENLNGILFFSPSAVESYASVNKIQDEVCFCIGNTTAKALKNITNKIVIANQPTIESTITKCIEFYSNIQ